MVAVEFELFAVAVRPPWAPVATAAPRSVSRVEM